MIAVEGLTLRRDGREVLRDVSLRIDPGEVHAVIGPSGGGKTTLLRCVNGLTRFHGGMVRVGGHALTPATDPRRDARLLQAVRRKVGLVFQELHLFPHLSVLDNLTVAPVHVLGERKDEVRPRALALLERVGVKDKAGELPSRLSGGERQRVALARALLMKPGALLLDEPTSALDRRSGAEVRAVLRDLAADGQTMLVVTHSLELARELATFVHVLAGGEAVERGSPEEVLGAPRHPETRALLHGAA